MLNIRNYYCAWFMIIHYKAPVAQVKSRCYSFFFYFSFLRWVSHFQFGCRLEHTISVCVFLYIWVMLLIDIYDDDFFNVLLYFCRNLVDVIAVMFLFHRTFICYGGNWAWAYKNRDSTYRILTEHRCHKKHWIGIYTSKSLTASINYNVSIQSAWLTTFFARLTLFIWTMNSNAAAKGRRERKRKTIFFCLFKIQ